MQFFELIHAMNIKFKLILSTVLLLIWVSEIHCQITKEHVKPLFFERIEKLSIFEGIFAVNEVNIVHNKSMGCFNDEQDQIIKLNDTIAILEIDMALLVFSYNSNCIIGSIKLDEQYRGDFYPNKKSQYPPCTNLSEQIWNWHVLPSELSVYNNILPALYKSLYKIEQDCNCQERYSREGFSEKEIKNMHICDLWVRFKINKIFPNKKEPPVHRASGTGVIINKDGYILTNRHVVERDVYSWKYDAFTWKKEKSIDYQNSYFNISTKIHTVINNKEYKLIPVEIGDGIRYSYFGKYEENKMPDDSSLIHKTIEEDLILLKIVDPPSNLKYAIFDTTALKLGQQIYTLGFPLSNTLNNQLIYTNGYFAAQKIKDNNTQLFDIFNLSINPGNSGGGIFSAKTGLLLGIATARINDNKLGIKTEGIAFGTRLNKIVKLLKNNNYYCQLEYLDSPDKGIRPVVYNTNFYLFDDFFYSNYKLITRKIPILVKNNKINPNVSDENNQLSTIQILVE